MSRITVPAARVRCLEGRPFRPGAQHRANSVARKGPTLRPKAQGHALVLVRSRSHGPNNSTKIPDAQRPTKIPAAKPHHSFRN